MAEYIDREATCRDCFHYDVCDYHITEMTQMTVNECPHKFVNKADVVEVRHGHWYIVEYEYFTCSECGNSFYNGCESTAEAKQRLKDGLYDNYCGHCGAKMDGKDGTE